MLKSLVIGSRVRSHPLDQLLTSLEVTGISTAMQFVLESVLNLGLHILGDVASVSDVSDACQRDRDHVLVTEGWQILLKTSDNEGVGVRG